MRTIQELADTTTSHNTDLLAKRWLDVILESAQKKMFFLSVAQQYDLPEGTKDLVVPYRYGYWSTLGTSVTDTTTEGGAVSYTTFDNLKGVTFTPTPHAYGIAISNAALRKNAVNLIAAARRELSDYQADVIDQAIASALSGATDASSSDKGATVLYGGDAYSTATLESGDILTTDMIAKARRILMGTTAYYWSGSSFTASSEGKAPWFPEPDAPFVLFIAPEQEEALLTDSQFVNASEYGSGEIVLNGEIGKYLGIKVISSVNTPSATTWGSGGNLRGHTCLLVKAKYAVGIAWSQRPRLRIFEYPSELETRLVLEQDFQAKAIHTDAIVKLRVTDS